MLEFNKDEIKFVPIRLTNVNWWISFSVQLYIFNQQLKKKKLVIELLLQSGLYINGENK